MTQQRDRPQGSWLSIVLALISGLVIAGALFALSVAVVPFAGPFIVLAAVLVFGMWVVHYVIWGWWLGPRIREEVEAEELLNQDREEDAQETRR